MNRERELRRQLDAKNKELNDLQAKKELAAKNEYEMTDAEYNKMKDLVGEIKDIIDDLNEVSASNAAERMLKGGTAMSVANTTTPKTIGDMVVNVDNIKEKIKARGSVLLVENAGETHLTTGTPSESGTFDPALEQVDKSVVRKYRRATISDLFGSGTMTGTSLTYFVEVGAASPLGVVAEGERKHKKSYRFDSVTDPITKIAGFVKYSEEMAEDLPFIRSEIDGRLLYDLELGEEYQLINGTGTGGNLRGLLNRQGIQTESAANANDAADALFRAAMKVQTETGLTADGIVINPADYQKLRLKKDSNGQYFGGGFFQGQYGQGGIQWEPPIWGFRTIVSAAVAPGTAIVGAFSQGATKYRKGGIRIETANTDQDDFIRNLITTRAEKRVGLAVRRPDAFVKVTLSGSAGTGA